MAPHKKDSKEDKVHRVSKSVLAILAGEGESKLKISRLAQHAKVTRPWIYKQFGPSVDDLLFFSAKIIGSHFALGPSAHPMNSPAECLKILSEASEQSLLDLEQWPWIPEIYLKYATRSGPIGDAIREVERLYINRVAKVVSEVFKLKYDHAETIALALIKIWAALGHSWVKDARIRKLGSKAVVKMMMLPVSDINHQLRHPF